MSISDRLRSARTAVGKTQEQVAVEAGMNITQYNGYERGRSRPAPATLDRLAAALATTPTVLLGGDVAKKAGPAMGSPPEVLHEPADLIEMLRKQVSTRLQLPLEYVQVSVNVVYGEQSK